MQIHQPNEYEARFSAALMPHVARKYSVSLQITCATTAELRILSARSSFTPYYHALILAEIGRRMER